MAADEHVFSDSENYQFGILREHLNDLGADVAPIVERALDQIERWSDRSDLDQAASSPNSVIEDQKNGERLLAELANLINQWPDTPPRQSHQDNAANTDSRRQFRIAIALLVKKIESELQLRKRAQTYIPVAEGAVDWKTQASARVEPVNFVIDRDAVRSVTFPYPEITAGRRDATDPVRPRKVSANPDDGVAVWPNNPSI